MNANVIVGNESWIDEAADNDAGSIEASADLLLLANESVDRLPTERFNRRDQPLELRSWLFCSPGSRVIRLAARCICRIAQLDPPALDDGWRGGGAVEHDRTRPTGLDREPER